jgi:hypothetical protein
MTWRVGGIAAVLVAVVAAVAVVFGGHHAGALDPVANAADATAQAGSAEVGIAATVTAAGQTIPLTGSGTVDMRNHSGRLSLSTTATKAGAMTFDEILNGTTFYIRMPQLANRLPGGKQWLKIDLQAFGKTKGIDFGKVMQSGNNNPADLLRFLKAAGNSRVVGREDIRGTPTTHYTASIDLAKAADRIGDKQTADSLKALYAQSGATTMPLDVWIDRVGRVRREHFSLSMSAGGSPASMDMTLEFIRFGVPVDATPPPGDQVLDAAALAGAAGG